MEIIIWPKKKKKRERDYLSNFVKVPSFFFFSFIILFFIEPGSSFVLVVI